MANRVDIRVAGESNYAFSNSKPGDLIFSLPQSGGVFFGTPNASPILTIAPDVVTFAGNIEVAGNLTQNGVPYVAGGSGGGSGGGGAWSQTSNVNTMYVLGSNIGIGTSNPSQLLDVAGNVASVGIRTSNISASNASIVFVNASNVSTSNISTVMFGSSNIRTSNISAVIVNASNVSTSNISINGDFTITNKSIVLNGLKIGRAPASGVPQTITQSVTSIPGLDFGGTSYKYSLSNSQTGFQYASATGANMLTLTSNAQLQASSNDTVTAPAYSWQGDSNTGMYHAAQRSIGFACAGSNILSLSASNVTVNGSLNATNLQQQGSNLAQLFAGSNHDAGAITTGTLAAARLPANISSAITTLTTSNVTVNGSLNATNLQQQGSKRAQGVAGSNPEAGAITTGTLAAARLPTASTTQTGIVQLTDSTSSTSTTTAATPNSVKSAYDLANTANNTANAALPKSGGTVTGNLTVNGTLSTSLPTFNYSANGSTAFANTVFKYTLKVYDTHNAYNTTTGRFTAPANGYYMFIAQGNNSAAASGTLGIALRKNGTYFATTAFYTPAQGSVVQVSGMIYLTTSDYVDVYNVSSMSLYGNNEYQFSGFAYRLD